MAIMVTSFRTSLDQWTQRILPADVYVRLGYVDQSAHLEAGTAQRLGALPGVAHFETGRFARAQLSLSSQPVTLVARSANRTPIPSALWMTETAQSQPRGAFEDPSRVSRGHGAARKAHGGHEGLKGVPRSKPQLLGPPLQGAWLPGGAGPGGSLHPSTGPRARLPYDDPEAPQRQMVSRHQT